MYLIDLITYKIYKFRLNWINKKPLSKGMLPIMDTKGYPCKNYQTISVRPLPLPIGKIWYPFYGININRKFKINKLNNKWK